MKLLFILFLLLALLPNHSKAIAGTDWGAQTPHGNMISDNWGPKSLIVNDSFVLQNLQQWYFYKGHIIGKYAPNEGSLLSKYFLFNEYFSELDTFSNSNEWSQHIQKKHLQPTIWTRWHSGDWDTISVTDFLVASIILFALIILLSVRDVRSKLKIQNPRTFFFFALAALVIVLKWKTSFPESF